jgi:hypothetical protein
MTAMNAINAMTATSAMSVTIIAGTTMAGTGMAMFIARRARRKKGIADLPGVARVRHVRSVRLRTDDS